MLTKEQYEVIVGYKPICEHYVKHQTYVGGADGLFDYLEQQGLTGGTPIRRNCPECTAGFLKFTYSVILLYEKTNGSTEA